MNNADKITALLASPSVESITIPYDLGNGKMHSVTIRDVTQFNYAMFDQGTPEYFEVNWHEWPEISNGDLVMTPDGEGKVEFRDNQNYGYLVRSSDSKLPYMRHEIALLQKEQA